MSTEKGKLQSIFKKMNRCLRTFFNMRGKKWSPEANSLGEILAFSSNVPKTLPASNESLFNARLEGWKWLEMWKVEGGYYKFDYISAFSVISLNLKYNTYHSVPDRCSKQDTIGCVIFEKRAKNGKNNKNNFCNFNSLHSKSLQYLHDDISKTCTWKFSTFVNSRYCFPNWYNLYDLIKNIYYFDEFPQFWVHDVRVIEETIWAANPDKAY